MSLGKSELKQWDAMTHLLMTQIQTTPNAGEKVEQKKLSLIAGGNANHLVTMEERLVATYKNKYIISINPEIPISGICRVEHIYPYKTLHPNVYSHVYL